MRLWAAQGRQVAAGCSGHPACWAGGQQRHKEEVDEEDNDENKEEKEMEDNDDNNEEENRADKWLVAPGSQKQAGQEAGRRIEQGGRLLALRKLLLLRHWWLPVAPI